MDGCKVGTDEGWYDGVEEGCDEGILRGWIVGEKDGLTVG